MKIRVFFLWYDCWIGFYWDRKERLLYVCPLPMVVVVIEFHRANCIHCGSRIELRRRPSCWCQHCDDEVPF